MLIASGRSTMAGRARRIGVAAILALSMAAVGTGGIAATSGAASLPINASDVQLMQAEIPLDRAAERIEAVSSFPSAGFAGVVVSAQDHRLTLYWKGTMPTTVATVVRQVRAEGTNVAVSQAPNSQQELMDGARRILAASSHYLQQGISVTGVNLSPQGAGLEVNATVATVKAGSSSVAPALDDLPSGISVRIVPSRPATPLSRLDDVKPHWAGARLVAVIGNSEFFCTTGFPIVRNSDGRTFLVTAGHCGNDPAFGTPWWAACCYNFGNPHADGNEKMGDTWDVARGLDAQIIRSDVQGKTYDGGVKAGTEFSKPVVGTSGNQPGDWVCQSGASMGIRCHIQIVQQGFKLVNGSLVQEWSGCDPGAFLVCQGDTAGEGDSGGPVFSLASNPNQVLARGMVDLGLGRQSTCRNNDPNDPNGPFPCFSDIGFVDIGSILNHYGARIATA
jgi:hypothetical protein